MQNQQQTDINDVFDLFEHQQSGKIITRGFIKALEESNLSKNTKVLQQLIGNSEELNKQQYDTLFTNNVKNPNISSAFFHQFSGGLYLDLNHLQNINSQYNLGLKLKDMQLIINMIGENGEITLNQLQTMLSQY